MTAFLDTALAIARRISRDAIWAGDCCNWIGPSLEGLQIWDVRQKSFGPDLYSGTAGVALFLALAAHSSGDQLLRKTAEGAARHAARHAAQMSQPQRIGVYVGTVGVGWALTQIGRILEQAGWTEQGLALIAGAEVGIESGGLDVLSGCAGAIPVLLDVAQQYGRPAWLQFAIRCGEKLERASVRTGEGWSWKTIDIPDHGGLRNLTGFSHGTAGIGWALLELSQATGEHRFRTAAEEAFRYERTHFNREQENWPDFRDYLRPPGTPGPVYGTAWCHGAPGIALSRMRAWELTSDPLVREEAEAAVRTTRRVLAAPDAAKTGSSLCHGCAGNADVLLEASRCLQDSDARDAAVRIGQEGIEHFESQRLPWPCGIPNAGESASLMLGTAGIGHFYLRLAKPEIPTILRIGKS